MSPAPSPILGLLPTDRIIYEGDRVDLVIRPVQLASGKTRNREVCLHRGAVIILPVLDDGRVVLIHNMRHTVGVELLELPAGTLEYAHPPGKPGDLMEDPAARAAVELTEETGYTATTIHPFGWFFTSPGILTEKMYAFVATGLTLGHQELEEGEEIRTEAFSKDAIFALIRENKIHDAKTLATLLKYFSDASPLHATTP